LESKSANSNRDAYILQTHLKSGTKTIRGAMANPPQSDHFSSVHYYTDPRVGFVTESPMRGTPELKISRGHKSPAVLHGYIRDMDVGQVDVIRRVFGEVEG
jgi:hypothetical protein